MVEALGNLYVSTPAGISVMEMSLLRHYASRVDMELRWAADRNWALANPGKPGAQEKLQAQKPEVPDFSILADLGWKADEKLNLRAILDPDTGKPQGSYGMQLFTNDRFPDTIFRVNVGTDTEGYSFPFGVFRGEDGAANLNMAKGNLDEYLIQFAVVTKRLFSENDGKRFIDLNESMSGITAPLGAAIASGMNKEFFVYSLSASPMSAMLANTINSSMQNPDGKLRAVLEPHEFVPIATIPGVSGSDDSVCPVGCVALTSAA